MSYYDYFYGLRLQDYVFELVYYPKLTLPAHRKRLNKQLVTHESILPGSI